jgi:hypothetical protein
MGRVLDSLDFLTGGIIVAVLSVGIVWFLCRVSPVRLHALWIVIAPFVVAYCVYWSPVWLGAGDSSEYHIWGGMIVFWFLAGFFPSAFLSVFRRKRRQRESLS